MDKVMRYAVVAFYTLIVATVFYLIYSSGYWTYLLFIMLTGIFSVIGFYINKWIKNYGKQPKNASKLY